MRPRFVVLLWLTACAAVPRLPAASAARIDAAAVKEVKDGAVAGVSVAVARGGEVTFAAGWGLASLDPPIPAGADTRYRIQSIAKLLTAVAALKLVEDGRLALADPVARWFPGLPAGVTVRHLLTHTSGLADFWKLEPYKRSPPERPVDVVPLVAAAPPNFAPGTRFDYANTNFLLLGLIVERVAGRPLADVLADAVFRPAGMTATGLDCDAISTRGYARTEGKLAPAPPFVVPAGDGSASVCASAPDLARFAQALVSGKLLRPDTVTAMLTPQALADGRTIPFGLGADLEPFDGRPAFGHLGGGAGFVARLTHFRDEGVTVVVLANTASGSVTRLRFYAGRAARGVLDPGGTPRPVPADRVAAFRGDWRFDGFVLTVYDKDGAMWARVNDPAGERLVYLGDDVFGGTEEPDIRLRFSGDELVLDYYGTPMTARRAPPR
ncbi:MAG TPA: serine hydrolase domain-containing protein [Haliangiales bacterium]|nr:serine hydrolase domain-containing protein [Haliangiales bacterium]